MNPDIKLAYDTIIAKNAQHTEAFQYYDGVQPLTYANDRLREVFSGTQVKFTENWCGVVVDAARERMQVSGFTVPTSAQSAAETLWDSNQLGLLTDDVHEAALITGEAYVIVWPDEQSGEVEIYYNDPRLCHVFYDPQRPRKARMAAKMWVDESDECYRMILYYADHLEYYRTTGKATSVSSAAAFVYDDTQYPNGHEKHPVNEYGYIPVFQFVMRQRYLRGDLFDVIPLQNGINKLLTDMMVAGEFGAFKQRWVISNAELSTLKNRPSEIWDIPAGDGIGQATSVGEFSSTDLGNYLEAIENLATTTAKITRTPMHYFFAQGGYPSGEALIAMEAPLNFKVQARQERFEPVWREVMTFALSLMGQSVKISDVVVNWKPVQTVQPETEARILVLNGQAGIPLETSLRRAGWTDSELEDLAAAKVIAQAKLGEGLLASFDRDQQAE